MKAIAGGSSTHKITVYYSQGSAKRALALRTMVEGAMSFYEQWLGVRVPIELVVLNKVDWVQLGSIPYGVPYSTPPTTVVMPTTFELFDSLGQTVRSGMPESVLKQLQMENIRYETAIHDFVDSIAFHELGHLYVQAFGVGAPNRWLDEFLASYLWIACEVNHVHNPGLIQFRVGFTSASLAVMHPEHTTLEDFERQYLDVGFSNYSWYETQFLQRAMQVYERKGLSFLSEIRTIFPADEKEPLSVDVVLARLEKVAPGFLQWADGLKRAGK